MSIEWPPKWWAPSTITSISLKSRNLKAKRRSLVRGKHENHRVRSISERNENEFRPFVALKERSPRSIRAFRGLEKVFIARYRKLESVNGVTDCNWVDYRTHWDPNPMDANATGILSDFLPDKWSLGKQSIGRGGLSQLRTALLFRIHKSSNITIIRG